MSKHSDVLFLWDFRNRLRSDTWEGQSRASESTLQIYPICYCLFVTRSPFPARHFLRRSILFRHRRVEKEAETSLVRADFDLNFKRTDLRSGSVVEQSRLLSQSQPVV